ncbi:hypothetical protein GCM10007935_34510 [Hydrogenophaga electricum]|uniref:Uncharacterized protein n=1 Tax=Hydrogenophaga electricum TaxID=1230953 RepID=A0ABQ6C8N3_9BURK|nr:hypothetical protein GCM10007935_34510 [Hydrogenophaga electricum]
MRVLVVERATVGVVARSLVPLDAVRCPDIVGQLGTEVFPPCMVPFAVVGAWESGLGVFAHAPSVAKKSVGFDRSACERAQARALGAGVSGVLAFGAKVRAGTTSLCGVCHG